MLTIKCPVGVLTGIEGQPYYEYNCALIAEKKYSWSNQYATTDGSNSTSLCLFLNVLTGMSKRNAINAFYFE